MKKRKRVKGAGWATGSDTATVLARVALAAEVDGYCDARTPEAMTEDDLVQAITEKVRDAQAYMRGESKRVKCGEAWAVRFWDGTWLDSDSPFAGRGKVSHTRAWRRRMFDSQHNAASALRRARKDGLECPSARIVRVTFYEVRR